MNAVERRILVLAPTGKDALLTGAALLREGIDCVACRSTDELARRLAEGAGALLVAEEALQDGAGSELQSLVRSQPPWSDLPILLLTVQGADSATVEDALDALGNVVVLERPMRVTALVSAVRAALRARARQYEVRTYISERERSEEALREASRRKDEFLAMLAHELRNPLAPIRSSLQVLGLTSHDPATEQARAMMERQVNHVVRLVDDLLEVSRITRGKMELRIAPLDLAAVIRSAVEAAESQVSDHGHRLVLELPTEPVPVDGDAVRLAQVFGNLLHNAIKFTPDGGRITLRTSKQSGQAVVSLCDTGPGISAQSLPHVFDLFMQDRSSSRMHGGLGLGLTLVKSLVEMHGGTVEAHSEGPGCGSEFVVRLPLAIRETQRRQPVAPAPSGSVFAQHRILVVDDNRDAADSLATLLRLLGAEVRVVYGGRDALMTLGSYKPGVAFVDIGMPDLDGYEVARAVRSRPELQDVTLVALTGWGQEEDRRQSRAAGFDHHLIKPTDVTTLQGILQG